MFNNIIEFIQNSVATVVGLAVSVLGIGAGDFSSQTANISDAVLPVMEEAVVEEDEPDGSILILTQETELTRSVNPIKSIKGAKEIDVSLLLKIDFDKFDPNLQIIKITEDENSFYSTYQFRSFAIKNNIWQEVIKEKQISVTKVILGDQDLGNYLSEELGEVIDNEIVFLKEVQIIQKAKQKVTAQEVLEQGGTQIIATDYSALIGKVLNVENEQFNNYIPKVETTAPIETKDNTIIDIEPVEVIEENTPNTGITDNEAPLVIIQGNNPALIQIGSSYLDLGAMVIDNLSNNLEVEIGGDVVNTSLEGSYFVTYTAVDESGNVATATREVIVYDYGAVAEVIIEEEPAVVEEIIEVDETATTTEEVEEEILIEDTTSVVEVVAETPEVVAEVVEVLVENVVEGSKNAGKKVKETAEIVADTTAETIKQISEGIEAVAEEISAIIKATHFMELLGNIRLVLQASIINISNYKKDSGVVEENKSEYQKESFIGFIFRKIIETPQVIIDKIINTSTGLTATVKYYGQTVSSDLEVAGQQIDQKIIKTDFSPRGVIGGIKNTMVGTVSNVFNFFKTHRP